MSFYHNWWEEKRSAYLYSIMALHEANIPHKKLFNDLKDAANTQASVWEAKMRETGEALPLEFKPDIRTRIVSVLIKLFGSERLHYILSAMKIRGMSVFTSYHHEHLHTTFSSANNLRAAVFGINDGLISNASLMLGIAGANAGHETIIIAGIAGLLAGACSMGAGEYISVRSQREVYEYQIAIEKEELLEYPEEEANELMLIYEARGVPKEEARKLANLMIQNPETGLNTLAREELGLNPEDMVSPIGAMIASFVSFAAGALIPLLPFFIHNITWNLHASIGLTAISLFLVGSLLSLYTNRNPIWLGLRMMFIGAIAGGITFVIGKLLGTAIL